MVLTLAGAAGMIIGAFMEWVGGTAGTNLSMDAFYRTTFGTTSLIASAGFAMIVLGLLAIVGLALPTGWLSRLAAVLGIVAFALFAIEVYRVPGGATLQIGAWISLAGSIVVLAAGFFGGRREIVRRDESEPATADE
jgi:hypothetical protein